LPHHFLVFLFAALLFPVAEALIGAAAYDTQSAVASYASLVFLLLSFLFTVVATIKEKGRRRLRVRDLDFLGVVRNANVDCEQLALGCR
jgi:hypothetical protein